MLTLGIWPLIWILSLSPLNLKPAAEIPLLSTLDPRPLRSTLNPNSFIQNRNQGLEELSNAIESEKATDSLVVSTANLDGRIYTFRRDSVYVLEDAAGVAQVTIGDPDAPDAQVIRLSPADGVLSQVLEAPRAPKPRPRMATTWASIKKG